MDNTDTSSFHIYYRIQGAWGTPSPRDHIIKDGEALCNYGVSVPDEELLKPVSEVSDSEWAVFLGKYSNLCSGCAEVLDGYDIIPDDLPEPPEFNCPVCEETADSISFTFEMAVVAHKDESQFPPAHEEHAFLREFYDMWRFDPDEPESYQKLKAHIEDHPHVFRREEYRKQKILAQIESEE